MGVLRFVDGTASDGGIGSPSDQIIHT